MTFFLAVVTVLCYLTGVQHKLCITTHSAGFEPDTSGGFETEFIKQYWSLYLRLLSRRGESQAQLPDGVIN